MIAMYTTDVLIEYKTKQTLDLPNMTLKQREAYVKKRKVDKSGNTKIETFSQTLRMMPVIMNDGISFPSEKYERDFINKHGRVPIGKLADYDATVRFENIKFSSRLQYEFKD
jgi:hypothetical protein